jgi:hypothetical protein
MISWMQAVRKAYEQLVLKPAVKHDSYGADSLFSRAVILKSAAECLLDLNLRRSYDEKASQRGHTELRISNEDVPGALILMQVSPNELTFNQLGYISLVKLVVASQEIGKFEMAIPSALSWLGRNSDSPDADDVASCLAASYWDRAASKLGVGNVLEGCDDLEKALVLLQR